MRPPSEISRRDCIRWATAGLAGIGLLGLAGSRSRTTLAGPDAPSRDTTVAQAAPSSPLPPPSFKTAARVMRIPVQPVPSPGTAVIPMTPPFSQDPPTPTPTPPATFGRGDTVYVAAWVQSRLRASAAVVYIEIVDPSGATARLHLHESQVFNADQTLTYWFSWRVPLVAVTGEYGVRIGVFDSGWGERRAWDPGAARFPVV